MTKKSRNDCLATKVRNLEADSQLRQRLHRSLSWLKRAASERDVDARYIFLWIAFNAAYAVDRKPKGERKEHKLDERERFAEYLRRVTSLDTEGRILVDLRSKLAEPILELVKNKYVSRAFWDSVSDEPFDWVAWERKSPLNSEREDTERRLGLGNPHTLMEAKLRGIGVRGAEDAAILLTRVFDRLYLLRNQLMHGCATQDGALNRRQVKCGAEILTGVIPLFLGIMLDQPEEEWGPIPYPAREDIREDGRERR